MHREDLLNPDVISEVILVGAGAILFIVMIVLLAVIVAGPSAPI
ncbi:MAG: hypothetical protein ACRD20_02825 [Terriglobales bacterium]